MNGTCDFPGCQADATGEDLRTATETCPDHPDYHRPRTFAADSTSYPVHAALETHYIADPEQRGAAWAVAHVIGLRAWGRPELPAEQRDQIRERWGAAFPAFADRRALGYTIRQNIERARDYAASVSTVPEAPTAQGLLRKAARQFRFYEKNHLAKGTTESTVKAHVNGRLALEIELFLGQPQ